MIFDYLLMNGNCFIDGEFKKTNIGIYFEKIAYIGEEEVLAKEVIDCSEKIVLPGLIDPHTHFQLDCKNFVSADDFYFGSKAALFGGVTTIIDFLDPSSNVEELIESFKKRKLEASTSLVDYRFHACLIEPTCDLEDYVKAMLQLGIKTVKVFTTYSDTNRMISDASLEELLKLSHKYNFLVLVHAEDDKYINVLPSYTYKDLLISRPTISEVSEVEHLAQLVFKYGGYLYIVHVSSGKSLELLKKNYSSILNKNIFIESCPQYFIFNSDILSSNNGHLFTFAPPLREEDSRLLLVKNFDLINTIGTDHCPFNKKDKEYPSLLGFPMGVGGIEYSFTLLYKRFGKDIIEKMSKNIAKIDLISKKGELKVGYDADISVFVEGDEVISTRHGRSDYSIYTGLVSKGHFEYVFRRGKMMIRNNNIASEERGKII